MKKTAIYALRASIVAGLLAITAGLIAWCYPPAAMVAIAAVRGSECSLWDVLRGADQHYREGRVRASLEQIQPQRTEDGMQLWSTRYGDFWFPLGKPAVAAAIIAQQATDLYAVAAAGPRVVFDVGAHVGTFTRRALDAGVELVVAIEPAPENLRCLRRNLAREIAAGRVVVIDKGAWDKDEVLAFYHNPQNSAGDSFVYENGNEKPTSYLPLTTIDKIAAELKLGHVDMIKMDIKGAARRALLGARGVILRDRPLVVIATEEDEDRAEIISTTMAALGGYGPACGACIYAGGSIWPNVVFYRHKT